MLENLKNQCMNYGLLVRQIRNYAKIVSNYHRNYGSPIYDVSDIENDLWVAVFEAIDGRYAPEIPLLDFSLRVAYSKYGSMVRKFQRHGKIITFVDLEPEFCTPLPLVHPDYDYFENRVHVKFTLDQIERDLKNRYAKSRYYRIAITQFQCLRKGMCFENVSKKLKLPNTTCIRVFNRITKRHAKKYSPYYETQEANHV